MYILKYDQRWCPVKTTLLALALFSFKLKAGFLSMHTKYDNIARTKEKKNKNKKDVDGI